MENADQIAAEVAHYYHCLGKAITRMDVRAANTAGDILNILSIVQTLLTWTTKSDIPEGVVTWNLEMCRKHLHDIQENYSFLRKPAPDLGVSFTLKDLLELIERRATLGAGNGED